MLCSQRAVLGKASALWALSAGVLRPHRCVGLVGVSMWVALLDVEWASGVEVVILFGV